MRGKCKGKFEKTYLAIAFKSNQKKTLIFLLMKIFILKNSKADLFHIILIEVNVHMSQLCFLNGL